MAERLTNARLIELWEEGRRYPPYKAALLLVNASIAEDERAQLASWTIGQRDRHLLQLRGLLFGDSMACLARCPSCDEQVEFTLSVRELLAVKAGPTTSQHLEYGPYQLDYRLPTIADLDVAMASDDPGGVLLARSITAIAKDGKAVQGEILPPALRAQVAASIDEIDPLANIQLDLACAACETQWQSVFDITQYLWREISAWITRALVEVHIIASAYGWTEDVILGLSPTRRQMYLDLILGAS
jgi:hypothetical protein